MKIYIGHSRDFDYQNELYKPIRDSDELNKFQIILPHENGDNHNSRDFYSDIDILIAEVSHPSTGLGIELGWANDDNVPIFCIAKEGTKVSSSLRTISQNFFEYSSEKELIDLILEIIKQTK